MAITIEERISQVEAELEELRSTVGLPTRKLGWVSKIVGRHKNDPVFEEIVRLGKEIRDAEEPPLDTES